MRDPDNPLVLATRMAPAYCYDLGRVRAAYATLRAALPHPAELYYSLKANPHPTVVGELARLGAGTEICSRGELLAACTAQAAPEAMLYTGPSKTTEEVSAALRAGVRWFSVDSPHGLRVVDEVARRCDLSAKCILRLNGGEVAAGHSLVMTGQASQFGADLSWVCGSPEEFILDAGPSGADLCGFHVYQGTNLACWEALLAQFETAAQLCRVAADALGIEPALIDLGGGFAAPYAAAGELLDYSPLRRPLTATLDQAFPSWRDGSPRIVFESGRYLVATCGTLITRVSDAKDSYDHRITVLESGINHLGGMSGMRRLPPLTPTLLPFVESDPSDDHAHAGHRQTDHAPDHAHHTKSIVAGPLCTPLDVLDRRPRQDPPLRPHDLVTIPNVGAYGLTASLIAFLGHPAPAELVIDHDQVVSCSRLTLRREPVEPTEADAATPTTPAARTKGACACEPT